MSSQASKEFFQTFSTVDEYKQKICSKVIDVIRTSNRLAIEDFDQISQMKTSAQIIEQLRKRLLHRITQVKHPIDSTEWNSDDWQDQLEQLIEVNDTLFERIASALDRAEENANTKSISVVKTVMVKPQLKFQEPIDNSADRPFRPKLCEKPNAKTSLCDDPSIHPYHDEIEAFQPDPSLLTPVEAQLPKSLDETNYLFVDTTEKFQSLIEHLQIQSELAIDLEHHSHRSYQGLTCLMQISSRTNDYLIDTLILRHEMTRLNQIFTDPTIVKVFHGADWDIPWLQKDFSLYVVNMFDTHQAARELNFPNLSLAYLLKRFCHREVNKQYQLADWRIRPLPDDYLRYAREDTHYLLYIYDCLRNQLAVDVDRLRSVYNKSKVICQKVYQKAIFDENDFQVLYQKYHKTPFNGSQLAALKLLYAWRDHVAREEDESPGYVLPDLLLFQLAELLPRDLQSIRVTCKLVPELVEKNLEDIHRLITQAIEDPLRDDEDQCQSDSSDHNKVKRMKLVSAD